MNLENLLTDRLAPAVAKVAGHPADPLVRASQHADFQSGAALALARELGRPPRDVAADIVAAVDLDGLATAEVSGPGFVNLTFADDFLAAALDGLDDRLGVPPAAHPERIVIDYSAPNVAKEMHVGHLRSTVIGDALARMFAWLGHDVIRANHLGDWGTQFGMLIEHLAEDDAGDHSFADLTAFYRAARVRFDADPDFRERARLRVVALQNGEERTRELWRRLVGRSEKYFLAAYERLGVTLQSGDFVGESFYQDRLAPMVAELSAKGLLTESEGALCAFPPGFTGRSGEPLPLIVRKGDGGFGYAATDLAALRYRTEELTATRLLYVVGAPQRIHFRMVFAVAGAAGWLDGAEAEHVEFGSVLGSDGRMLRTRSGDSVRLADLLTEATNRSGAPEVGIGAIKYADLAADRRSDYVFDWDRMLATTGSTGPYLQYAYARIQSIFRQADGEPGRIALGVPAERALAVALLGFEPAVAGAVAFREPHRLVSYLHELAVAFSVFYERCPVRWAEGAVRASRLSLADRTARTLARGLDLVGIAHPDRLTSAGGRPDRRP